MGTVILAAVGGALVALLGVGLVTVVRRRSRTRADLEAMLAAAQHEADDLRARLEELTALVTVAPEGEEPAYLITDVGVVRAPAVPEDQIQVPDRLVLSATMGEPLVKVAALGHGLRRALSPESRNRIWFEMRREVRAARKRRRQLLKQYQRDIRAAERAQEGLA
ncbi:hypothetical protein [Nocardioides marmorisolisilvae]|uniref:Uncharacterized protein n=1 Tax=Nocardioides marmorisolisilvae TaxID=1542737 RepID=A0A3N0DUK3_9ACTN|nr:hypothetical protein [Nocardioides marmorisolisilvae]RNL79211.1 hypothetical protein EFL95_09310 [Nocardioides marmorisolisilvae]